MNARVAAGPSPPVGLLPVPTELAALADRVRGLPFEIRRNLEPVVDEAVEEAIFRGQTLELARQAMARFRHDLELIRFDLDMTRRERERLQRDLERMRGAEC